MARAGRDVDLTAPWRALVQVVLAALILSGAGLAFTYEVGPGGPWGAVASLPAHLRALHHWAGILTMAAAVGFAVRAWLRGADRERAYPSWGGVLGAVIGAAFLFLGGRILVWDDVGRGIFRRFAWWLGGSGGAGAVLPAGDAPLVVLLVVHIVLGVVAAVALVLVWRRHDGRSWSAFLHRALVMPWGQRLARRVALAFLAFLVVLVVAFPPAVGPSGRPLAPPPWPFLWTVPVEHLVGIGGFWFALLGGSAVLGALPFWGAASRRVRVVVAVVLAALWVALGVTGALLLPGGP